MVIFKMSGGEKFSLKLYAFAMDPKIKYSLPSGRTKIFTDISIAISRAPTLQGATGMNANDILDKTDIRGMGSGKRIIEYPGSNDLSVSEFITRYDYESPIPEWLGWIIGFVLVSILQDVGGSLGVFDGVIPSWVLWLVLFIPLGMAWSYVFSDKEYYLSEVYVGGVSEKVLSFGRELRNNIGRDPIGVLSLKDLERFEAASGLDVVALEESWKIIEKKK